MKTSSYRLKYITDEGEICYGSFAKLYLILHRLEQLLNEGKYCIVVDENDVEYKPPTLTQEVKPKYPSQKPLMIDAIVAYMKKPENVARREKAKLDDEAMWAKLRNS